MLILVPFYVIRDGVSCLIFRLSIPLAVVFIVFAAVDKRILVLSCLFSDVGYATNCSLQ